MSYAIKTQVPIVRSKAEIERILVRYGAEEFQYGSRADRARVMFRVRGRLVRFDLPLPVITGTELENYGSAGAQKRWEQACRSRWRALALVIKAKLEAVESGIVSFESEFMAHLVTAGGRTLGERLLPDLDATLRKAAATPLLTDGQEKA